jgi:hypothetical protein
MGTCLVRASLSVHPRPPMQHARIRPPGSSRVYVGTEAKGTMYSLANVNHSLKKKEWWGEAMTKLKSTTEKDVDIALTSKA